nr:MAG TPA: hypothetical protein [Caudoviricetes sp.]
MAGAVKGTHFRDTILVWAALRCFSHILSDFPAGSVAVVGCCGAFRV